MHPLLKATAWLALSLTASAQHAQWSAYGGAPDGAQYSALRQVNRTNVKHLRPAWTFPTGDDRGYAFNPLVLGDTMFVLARNNSIVALDAASGTPRWTHPLATKTPLLTNRGLTYWQNKTGTDRRLLFAADNLLQELDARTGQPIRDFGVDGAVDLREGLNRDPATLTLVQSYNPGVIFQDLIVFGSATNEEYSSAPGDIRAYNVLTGALAWSFHTIPHPGDPGYDTWPPDAWRTVGGANAWAGLALDQPRGILFVPTASPKYNFYGANRPGDNLFGDSLLALDARTGHLLWHFQMVHHDIWDYDNANTPMLSTVRHHGKLVDIVAQTSKTGFVWVFDRVTGKPLWPVEERPVPQTAMPGEHLSPTQPFPTEPPPFGRQTFTADDLSPYLEPAEREALRKQIEAARNQGLFTPPTTQDTVEMPGNNGGANFGGTAIDPARGFLYVVSKDLPAILKLTLPAPIPTGNTAAARGAAVYGNTCALCHGAAREGKPPVIPTLVNLHPRLSDDQIRATIQYGKGMMPAFATLPPAQQADLLTFLKSSELAPASTATTPTAPSPASTAPGPTAPSPTSTAPATPIAAPATLRYRSGFGFLFAESGLPVIAPPWTTLTAYDLNTGTIRWKIPLGDVPELAAQGIHNTGSHFPKVAPVLTAGGLLFTGTRDRMVRALDADTGKVLWQTQVGAALEGMPAIYQVHGREYIVFCAAARATTHTHATPGHPAAQDPIHGAYIAFALPRH